MVLFIFGVLLGSLGGFLSACLFIIMANKKEIEL